MIFTAFIYCSVVKSDMSSIILRRKNIFKRYLKQDPEKRTVNVKYNTIYIILSQINLTIKAILYTLRTRRMCSYTKRVWNLWVDIRG